MEQPRLTVDRKLVRSSGEFMIVASWEFDRRVPSSIDLRNRGRPSYSSSRGCIGGGIAGGWVRMATRGSHRRRGEGKGGGEFLEPAVTLTFLITDPLFPASSLVCAL